MRDPEHAAMERAAEHERGERWMRGLAVVLAFGSVAPTAYYLGETHRSGLTSRLQDLGSWADSAEGGSLDRIEAGAQTIGIGALLVAGAVFFTLMYLRRRAAAKAVERALAEGSTPRSPHGLHLTIAAWATLLAAAIVYGTVTVVAQGPNTSEVADRFVRNPAWTVLTALGLAMIVAVSWWYHRMVHELEPAGAVPTPAERFRRQIERREEPVTMRLGLRAYGQAMVIEGGFGVAGLGQGILNDTLGDVYAFAIDWLIRALVLPAMISGAFMAILFALRPTRWMVAKAWEQPLTRLALGAIAVGTLLVTDVVGSLPWWTIAVGAILVLGGGILAGITGLYLQDVGPQPILGISFLVLLYVANAFTTEQGDIALPAGPFAWAVALALGGFLVVEIVKMWRDTYGPPATADASDDVG